MKNNPLFFERRDFDTSATKMLSSLGAKDYDKYYDDMSKIQLNVYEAIQKYQEIWKTSEIEKLK